MKPHVGRCEPTACTPDWAETAPVKQRDSTHVENRRIEEVLPRAEGGVVFLQGLEETRLRPEVRYTCSDRYSRTCEPTLVRAYRAAQCELYTPQTTAILRALRIALTTFWTCALGSADGTKKCGDWGKGDDGSRGR